MIQAIRERWNNSFISLKNHGIFGAGIKIHFEIRFTERLLDCKNDKQEKSCKRNKTLALNSILDTSTHLLRL